MTSTRALVAALFGFAVFLATMPVGAEDLDATIARKVRKAKLATTLPIVWPANWQRVGDGKPVFVSVVALSDGYVIGLSHDKTCEGEDCSRSYIVVSSATAAKPDAGDVVLNLDGDVTATFSPTSWSSMNGITDAELRLRTQNLDIYLMADLTRDDKTIGDKAEQAIMTDFSRSILERIRTAKGARRAR